MRLTTTPVLCAGLLLVGALPAAAATARFAPVHVAGPVFASPGDLGLAPASTRMHVVLGLRSANRAAIDKVLVRQATPGDALYEKALTPQQARSLVAPSGNSVQAVAQFLSRAGFTNLHVTPDNLLVSGDATADRASRAFSTSIHMFARGSQRVLASVGMPHVPAYLRDSVVSVGGLLGGAMHPMAQKKPSVQSCTAIPSLNVCALGAFGPKDYQQVYDVPAGSASTAIAIFAEGDLTGVISDLRQQEAVSGLAQVPVTVVHSGPASTDTSGADEWDLDTQYSTGIANGVSTLYLYDAPSLTDGDITANFDRFVTDDVAKAGSASFGGCETLEFALGDTATDDAIFQEAALQGQTIFASSGDTGTFCPAPVVSQNGVPAGLPGQEYPASSPYVVAVGGTTLLANTSGSYYGEIGWYSGGGGPSLVETAGPWQAAVATAATLGQRAVPDVAMDGDPNTGANVIVAGTTTTIGGTSLSSPLALGVWARIESAHGNGLGFASPILYKEFADEGGGISVPTGIGLTKSVGGFHDVFYGANPLPASPGYDFSTGLGTFDVGLSISDILK